MKKVRSKPDEGNDQRRYACGKGPAAPVVDVDDGLEMHQPIGHRTAHGGGISNDDAERLAKACDYLPLAIEVTATTLNEENIFEVSRYLDRLEKAVLSVKAMDKVKAVVRWSLDLLPDNIHRRWCQLGVFEGDFTAAATGAIWDINDPEDTLAFLNRRSLVAIDKRRCHLHDILRAVALESPQESELKLAKVRHARYFCELLAEATKLVPIEDYAQRMNAYGRELPNILAAQHWIRQNFETVKIAKHLAKQISDSDLSLFISVPRRQLIEHTLMGLKADNKVGLAVAALEFANRLSVPRSNNQEEVIRWYQRSRILFRQLGIKEGLAEASGRLSLFLLPNARKYGGEIADAFDQAEEFTTEAADLYRELGWNNCLGFQLQSLAEIKYDLGKIEEAQCVGRDGDAAFEAFHGPNRLAMEKGRYDLMPKEETEHTRLINHWKHQLHDIRSMTPEIWENEICALPAWPEVDRFLDP